MEKETPKATEAGSKKPYAAPKLRALGSVRDLTLAVAFGTVTDGGVISGMTMMAMA